MKVMPKIARSVARANTPYIVSASDHALLSDLAQYGYATAAQLCRLRYGRSLTYVSTKLKRLADLGYLQRLFLPRPSARGSAPLIFRLDRKGLSYLKSCGAEVHHRYRPSEAAFSYLHLSHRLAVNDWLISLALLERASSRVVVADVIDEQGLAREPLRVEDADGRAVPVIADAWVDLRIDNEQSALWLELDRATEQRKAWQRKLAGILAATKGAYQEHFKTPSLTVAVTVSRGAEKRLVDLLLWSEAVLDELGERDKAELLRFTCVRPDLAHPQQFFFSRCWYEPFRRLQPRSGALNLTQYQAVPLLEEAV